MENDIVEVKNELQEIGTLDSAEVHMLERAGKLLYSFPDHALMEIWMAAVHNLRRRVEAFSIEMFLSSISDCSGRKKYKKEGDSLSERWSGVDDEILVSGASQLGVLNIKAKKIMETIEWTRNHASAAHETADPVAVEDVIGLLHLLKVNLFEKAIPDPACSPASLIGPIKTQKLNEEAISAMVGQIENYSNEEIRTLFGFSLDVISEGSEPQYSNVSSIFPSIWEKATDELRVNMGSRLCTEISDQIAGSVGFDDSKQRIYEMLVKVKGIRYIPEYMRTIIYRRLSNELRIAKNSSYGWEKEVKAAKSLAQIGNAVPTNAIEDVYQEILSVWCGNYWGRSQAYVVLHSFVFDVSNSIKLRIIRMFDDNSRVKEELFQDKPNKNAVSLLEQLKTYFTLQNQINEIEEIITKVKAYVQNE